MGDLDSDIPSLTRTTSPDADDIFVISRGSGDFGIKLKDFIGGVSVSQYGAVGDGVTDDTAAFTAAFAAFDSVYAPEGSYVVDNVAIPGDNKTIRGDGPGNTVLVRGSTNSILTATTARSQITIRDCTLDGASDYTSDILNFVGGMTDVLLENIEFINFDNGTNNSTAVEFTSVSNTNSERITIRDCYFNNNGGSVSSNYNTLLVYAPDVLLVENCIFDTCGNLATACPSTHTPRTGNITIRGNIFIGVDSTAVLVRVNGANIVENVNVVGNHFEDISPTLEKYCLTLGQHASTTTGGVTRNFNVIGNTARLSDTNCDGFLVLGDTTSGISEATNCTIADNVVDFTDSSGALITTGNVDQRGIWVVEFTNVSLTGNAIRGSQSFGIGIDGCTNWSVTGNAVRECLRNTSANANESAIYIVASVVGCSLGQITGNVVTDCGAGGTVHAGIGSNAQATITDILCSGNNVEDTRGTPAMTYGIRFGANNVRIVLGSNKVRGAVTTDIFGGGVVNYTPTNVTTDRSYDADTVAIAELADIVGTLISDLQGKGVIQ